METADLKAYDNEEVTRLPDGFRQRVAIARASVHRPRLLLLDEPVSGLERRDRLAVCELLHRVKERGATLFFATHALHELAELCSSMRHTRAPALPVTRGRHLASSSMSWQVFSLGIRRCRFTIIIGTSARTSINCSNDIPGKLSRKTCCSTTSSISTHR